jgi:hypothetical protein
MNGLFRTRERAILILSLVKLSSARAVTLTPLELGPKSKGCWTLVRVRQARIGSSKMVTLMMT